MTTYQLRLVVTGKVSAGLTNGWVMIVLDGLWALTVILTLGVPEEARTEAMTTAITLGAEGLWWLVSLRRQINNGTAGPGRKVLKPWLEVDG